MIKTNKNKLFIRRILGYRNALQNEIEIDSYSYSLLHINSSLFGHAPRPTRWIGYFRNKSSLIRFSLIIISFLWRYGISSLFFIYQFFKYIIFSTFSVKEIPIKSKIGLAFSFRATELIIEKNINEKLDCWILFPWVDSKKLSPSIQTYNIFSFLTFYDLLLAFKLSFKAVSVFNKYFKNKGNILQTYTAFTWFCTVIALNKIEGSYYFAEHFDRWAVLIDFVSKEFKRKNIEIDLNLIQHGLVGDICEESKLILSRKLETIKTLYALDEASVIYFKKYVFSSKLKLRNVFFYKNSLNLSNVVNLSKYSILFVGSPFCVNLHANIYNELKINPNLHIYYKPHPLYNLNKKIMLQNWEIINDKMFFPSVDLVISYPSTLAIEYTAAGTNCVLHPIDQDGDNLDKLLYIIKNYIVQKHS